MRRGPTVATVVLVLIVFLGISAAGKGKPPPVEPPGKPDKPPGKPQPPSEPDHLVCSPMEGNIQSTMIEMTIRAYEGGSWTDPELCRIWPEVGDAKAQFTYPNGVKDAWGQIWQLDRSQLDGTDRCYLHILMDDGQHYRVRQMASEGLVMRYDGTEDSWFFQFNNAELWNSDGYVAHVTFEFTVKRTS